MVLDVAVPVLHSTVPFTERFQTPSNAITYIFNRIIWDWIDCFFFNSARRNATLLVWIHLIKRSAFPFLIFINGAVHHVTSSETFLLAAEIVTNGHWMAPMQITVVAQSSFMSLSPDRVSNHLAPPPSPRHRFPAFWLASCISTKPRASHIGSFNQISGSCSEGGFPNPRTNPSSRCFRPLYASFAQISALRRCGRFLPPLNPAKNPSCSLTRRPPKSINFPC